MIYLLLALLGLLLGSFVNALVWRVHEQSKTPQDKDLSIVKGRSMCPHCRHTLRPMDLIPVISWLLLKGRCRYCRKAIGWQYPAIELLTAGLIVLSYAAWPRPLEGAELLRFGFWPVFTAGFVALLIYDLKWMLLPNRIIYPLMGLAVVQWLLIWHFYGVEWARLGFGVLVGGGLFYVLFQLSQGKWIGGGDVKLGFLLGLLLGAPMQAWLALFIAALLGSVVSVPLLVAGRANRKSRIPFGPFLLAGGYIVMLCGPAIIDWYERLMGLS